MSINETQLAQIWEKVNEHELVKVRGKFKLADITHEVKQLEGFKDKSTEEIITIIMEGLGTASRKQDIGSEIKASLAKFAKALSEKSEFQTKIDQAKRVAFRETIDKLSDKSTWFKTFRESLITFKRKHWGNKDTEYNKVIDKGIDELLYSAATLRKMNRVGQIDIINYCFPLIESEKEKIQKFKAEVLEAFPSVEAHEESKPDVKDKEKKILENKEAMKKAAEEEVSDGTLDKVEEEVVSLAQASEGEGPKKIDLKDFNVKNILGAWEKMENKEAFLHALTNGLKSTNERLRNKAKALRNVLVTEEKIKLENKKYVVAQ